MQRQGTNSKNRQSQYTYTASGQKLKVVQKWNPNYSTAPVIGSGINTTLLTQTKTTDYVGNIIYENGSLKRILVDGGYYEGGIYHYYLADHLGNNHVVAKSDGTSIQSNSYYPFGMHYAPGVDSEKQPYKYNGKELDQMHGLNMYDYSARYYESAIGRFTTVDPLAEKYYSISPYAYCVNNPLKFIDPDGRKIIPVNVTHRSKGSGKPQGINGLSSNTNAAMADIMKTTEGKAFFAQFAEKGQTFGGYTFTENGKYSSTDLKIFDYSWSKEKGQILPSNIEGMLTISENEDGETEVVLSISSNGRDKYDIGEIVTHETQIHGYKAGNKIDGKTVPNQDVDHKALKNKNIKHKGFNKYKSVRDQLEKINEKYKEAFKKAEEHAEKKY